MIKPGQVYAIPLFLPQNDSKENIKDYRKESFENKGNQFAFCRIIKDMIGSGILIEVFDITGSLDQNVNDIFKAKRLFEPVASLGLGIKKGRWKKIHESKNYDQEKDSHFSQIKLVLGISSDDLRLWQNGRETPISEVEAKKYEKWTVWAPTELEKRIVKELFSDN